MEMKNTCITQFMKHVFPSLNKPGGIPKKIERKK